VLVLNTVLVFVLVLNVVVVVVDVLNAVIVCFSTLVDFVVFLLVDLVVAVFQKSNLFQSHLI